LPVRALLEHILFKGALGRCARVMHQGDLTENAAFEEEESMWVRYVDLVPEYVHWKDWCLWWSTVKKDEKRPLASKIGEQ
jgi:hypothetical protein